MNPDRFSNCGRGSRYARLQKRILPRALKRKSDVSLAPMAARLSPPPSSADFLLLLPSNVTKNNAGERKKVFN